MAYRPQPMEPNNPNWTVRVVPNKFPALQIEGSRPPGRASTTDERDRAHEVIIETSPHRKLRRMREERIEASCGPIAIAWSI